MTKLLACTTTKARRFASMALFVGALLACDLCAMPGEIRVGQSTYQSRSKKYELRVELSDSETNVGASYSLQRDGQPVWADSKDFVLFDAEVTEAGVVFGYAYSQSAHDEETAGSLRIVAIALTGTVILDEVHERVGSAERPELVRPSVAGIFLHETSGKAVFRVLLPGKPAEGESWWSFEIDKGRALEKALLQDRIPNDEQKAFAVKQAMELPGTPFTVMRWSWLGCKDTGAHQLADGSPHTVWCSDFMVLGADWRPAWRSGTGYDEHECFSTAAKSHGAKYPEDFRIDRVEREGRFRLEYPAEGLYVSFAMERRSPTEDCWDVVEVDRVPKDARRDSKLAK